MQRDRKCAADDVYGVYLHHPDQLAGGENDRQLGTDYRRIDEFAGLLYEYFNEPDDAFDGICYDYA